MVLHLRQTTDVLASLSEARRRDPGRAGQVLVGFAAETAPDHDELLRIGAAKLERKGCDLLVLNDVSGGKVFGRPTTHVTVIDATGPLAEVEGSKSRAAAAIVDALSGRFDQVV